MALDLTGARALADYKSRRAAALAALESVTPATTNDACMQALIAAILYEVTTFGAVSTVVTGTSPSGAVTGTGTGGIA